MLTVLAMVFETCEIRRVTARPTPSTVDGYSPTVRARTTKVIRIPIQVVAHHKVNTRRMVNEECL